METETIALLRGDDGDDNEEEIYEDVVYENEEDIYDADEEERQDDDLTSCSIREGGVQYLLKLLALLAVKSHGPFPKKSYSKMTKEEAKLLAGTLHISFQLGVYLEKNMSAPLLHASSKSFPFDLPTYNSKTSTLNRLCPFTIGDSRDA